MRKLLTVVLMLTSFGFVGSWTATTANAVTTGNPQVLIQVRRRRHRDRDDYYRRGYRDRDFNVWNTTETRLVRDGWRTYRETYQVRHFPDGRTQMILISRERVYY